LKRSTDSHSESYREDTQFAHRVDARFRGLVPGSFLGGIEEMPFP